MTHDTVTAESASGNKMTKEQWLAVRKEAALQIDPETAEVHFEYAQNSTPTASTTTFRRNANVSGGYILPILQEAMYGCGLAIYPTRPVISATLNVPTISTGCK